MPSRLRIVCLVTQMEGGGAQRAAVRVTEGLQQRGHDVQCWFLYLKRPIYANHPQCHCLLDHPPRGALDYLRILSSLTRRLRTHQPDAVISFTHYANVLGQCCAWIAGVPCRVASQRNPASSYPRAARLADRVLGNLGLYHANVMVSHTARASFASHGRRYQRGVCVVPNGLEPVHSKLSQEQARLAFKLPERVPLALALGRLAHQKNHQVLLHAIKQVPSVHLAIAGEGELRAELEGLARELGVQERVHLLGEIEASRVADFLKAGDVFVMPSRFEGMSNAMLEAMLAGLPVIASDIDAQAEVLRREGLPDAGLLLPAEDVNAWVQAMRRLLLDDPSERERLASLSQARAGDYTVARMIDGFEQAVLEHVKQGKAHG